MSKTKSKPVWGKIEGTKAWNRKPCEEWKEFSNEDLFLCHNCNGQWPWYKYCNGQKIALDDTCLNNTYLYMNDDKNREGIRWSCDYCIDKILYDNNIIIITNIDSEIIKYRNRHPILN